MYDTRYFQYPAGVMPDQKSSTVSSALTMGGVGMVIGAAGSAAANIRRLQNGEIDRDQVFKNVVRDSAGAGVATATATAVVRMLGLTGLLSVAGTLATATAAKYIYDSAFGPRPVPASTQEAPKAAKSPKTTARKSPAAKTRKKTKSDTKKED